MNYLTIPNYRDLISVAIVPRCDIRVWTNWVHRSGRTLVQHTVTIFRVATPT